MKTIVKFNGREVRNCFGCPYHVNYLGITLSCCMLDGRPIINNTSRPLGCPIAPSVPVPRFLKENPVFDNFLEEIETLVPVSGHTEAIDVIGYFAERGLIG